MNTNTTATKTYAVALVNITDGSVQGHKAGCADLSHGRLRNHADEPWTFEVEDKADAWLSYNSDFLAEGGIDNGYEIEWAACTKHVPAGDQQARYDAAFGPEEQEAPEAPAKVTEIATVLFAPEEQEEKGQEVGPSFDADLATARKIFAEFGPYTGEHPLAAQAFAEAKDHQGRMAAVAEWAPGRVRRGFREMALRLEQKGRQEEAEVCWALRDDIDPEGYVFRIAG